MRQSLKTKFARPGPLDVYFRELSREALADVERSFFAQLRLSNGTYKTTLEHRLDDVNHLVLGLMPRGRHLDVMDVAVSSGISTAEWSAHLCDNRIDHVMTAGDLAVDALLMTLGRSVAVLWQDDGHPLALQIGRYSAYLDRGRSEAPPTPSRIGWRGIMARCLGPPLRVAWALARTLRSASCEANPANWTLRVRHVGLVSRQVAANRAIHVIRDDITEANRFREQFDVCRAANILNRTYFSDDVITVMAQNIAARVRHGGLLVVCRTINETAGRSMNLATVLRKNHASLEVIGRLNGGCDVENLVSIPLRH